MTQAKHTPAPWQLGRIGDDQSISTATHQSIATVLHPEKGIKKAARVTQEEAKANAHLIAAAPELLDVCRLVVLSVDEDSGEFNVCYDTLHAALKAIAKAEGNQ